MDAARRFTDKLVLNTKQSTGLAEKDAVVLVGVCLGALISVVFAGIFYAAVRGACGRVCRRNHHTQLNEMDKSRVASSEAISAQPVDSSNTEGCYRSSTDSDDEGEGVNAARIAQRRSKRNDQV